MIHRKTRLAAVNSMRPRRLARTARGVRRRVRVAGIPLGRLLLAGIVIVGTSWVSAADDRGGLVRSGQSLRELRAGDPDEANDTVAPGSADRAEDGLLRLVGLATGSLVLIVVSFLLWRRRRLRMCAGDGGSRFEIVDRVALSTRQWVCILRVDEKRIVVGVSGDTMTSLAVLDDDGTRSAPGRTRGGRDRGGQAANVGDYRFDEIASPASSSGADRGAMLPRQQEAKGEEAFWFRPDGSVSGEADSSDSRGDVSWENHLAPYRREVNRLRAMLKNWRESTDRGDRSDKTSEEGRGE